MNRTRGYTLIEIILALTITTVALNTIALVLHTLHRSARRLQDDADFERTVNRLAAQLREDAHNATNHARVTDRSEHDEIPAVTLFLPDGRTATYAIHDRGMERRVTKDETIRHREWYAFPGSSLQWAAENVEQNASVVTLVVRPTNRERENPMDAVSLRISAAVALPWPVLNIKNEEHP